MNIGTEVISRRRFADLKNDVLARLGRDNCPEPEVEGLGELVMDDGIEEEEEGVEEDISAPWNLARLIGRFAKSLSTLGVGIS